MSEFLKSDETVKDAVQEVEKNPLRTQNKGNGFRLVRRAMAYWKDSSLQGFIGTEHVSCPKDTTTIAKLEEFLDEQGVSIDVLAAVNARLDGKFRNAAQYITFASHATVEEMSADIHVIPFNKLKKDRVTIASTFNTFKMLYKERTWYSDFANEFAELFVSGNASKDAINNLMLRYIEANESSVAANA